MDNHFITLWKDEVKSLHGQIKYCENQIAISTENWVKKEYQGVLADAKKKLAEAEQHLRRLED